jgi:UDP-N-acetylglucosamine:LPS N-acetylglucosamine transferase
MALDKGSMNRVPAMIFQRKTRKTPRILAVASGGGHWVQLLRLRTAFAGAEVHYATVDASAAEMVYPAPVHLYPDANKDTKIKLALAALRLLVIVLTVRPDVVISTGAAGGYFAIRFAKMLGARTLFVDSIANARQLSVTGQMCRGVADRVISQWPEVARQSGTEFWGSVL